MLTQEQRIEHAIKGMFAAWLIMGCFNDWSADCHDAESWPTFTDHLVEGTARYLYNLVARGREIYDKARAANDGVYIAGSATELIAIACEETKQDLFARYRKWKQGR